MRSAGADRPRPGPRGGGDRLRTPAPLVLGDPGLGIAYPATGALVDAEGNPFSMARSLDGRSTRPGPRRPASAVLDIAGEPTIPTGSGTPRGRRSRSSTSGCTRSRRAQLAEPARLPGAHRRGRRRERRRLERDLHDGAQQRIVALALDAGRLARRRWRASPTPTSAARRRRGGSRGSRSPSCASSRTAFTRRTLQESGLAAALLGAVRGRPALGASRTCPRERAAEPAEAAAYQVVAETLRRVTGAPSRFAATATPSGSSSRSGPTPSRPRSCSSRTASARSTARLVVDRADDATTLRAELPCAS